MIARITRTAVLALIGFGCILFAAVPLQPGAAQWPMPDLLMMLLYYWTLRRPDSTPMLLVFGLGIVADLILMRPVGLGALTLVMATELLRSQVRTLREVAFVVEWLTIALLVTTAMGMQMSLLWLSLGTLPKLGEVALYAATTILIYPVVAILCGGILGLRHRRSGRMIYSTYLGEG